MSDKGLLHKVCTRDLRYTTLASNPEHLCYFCQRDPKRRVPVKVVFKLPETKKPQPYWKLKRA